ncbi:hypothetical protein [Acinetobacter sp.]|uniref:hypothetical protein n=1 Tax=Acinetobacter sp. TaxID=472 RepID=UPI0031CDEE2B
MAKSILFLVHDFSQIQIKTRKRALSDKNNESCKASSSWCSLPIARDIRITQLHIQQCDTLAADKAHSIKTTMPIQNNWINKKWRSIIFTD